MAWIVVAAEPMTDIDATAGEALGALRVSSPPPASSSGSRSSRIPSETSCAATGLEEKFGPERFFPTLGVALSAYLSQTSVDWVDWEDRP